uniref:NADH-ubiquinone oxidoreductase chain 1 n=1 Tax=Metaphycus eriococci TaxID=2498640 RepID=A0A7T3PGT3_9HYME|nr:NADH dehydrogenase subunit 1 [Metaphycus eriococci]QPZ53235.1 NADH dehydrogenase subunit 1 [Metaphycus eriococci]
MWYFVMFLNFIINSLIMMVMILISVAFLTLLERKVLGYIQIRKGPNKVGIFGIFQPFSDAIKLFSKEMSLIFKSNYMFYMLMPMMSMMLMLFLWNLLPYCSYLMNLSLNILMFLCILSLGVYSLMISGWSSNSIYSLLGGLRSIAQTISYEVSMILIMFSLIILMESMNFYNLIYIQFSLWMLFMNFFLMLTFFVSLLAELNRTPFDFSEGESELVSGFNTEYMSGSFALIFIAEYGMIMLMMMMFSIFFLGGNFWSFYFYLIYMFMLFFVIWVRGTYPRFRYDNLMYLTWMSFLPFSLNYLIYMLSMKMF